MSRPPPSSSLARPAAAAVVYKGQGQFGDSPPPLHGQIERPAHGWVQFAQDADVLPRDQHPGHTPRERGVCAVSYTHLRAHETVLDLVCRLLLEKKREEEKFVDIERHTCGEGGYLDSDCR